MMEEEDEEYLNMIGNPQSAAREMITQGVLNAIFNHSDQLDKDFPEPVYQCLQMKSFSSEQVGERWRLVLSDIEHFVQCILVSQQNHLVLEGKLKVGSIVRVRSYTAHHIKDRIILILLDLVVIESLGEHAKIGHPVSLPLVLSQKEYLRDQRIDRRGDAAERLQ